MPETLLSKSYDCFPIFVCSCSVDVCIIATGYGGVNTFLHAPCTKIINVHINQTTDATRKAPTETASNRPSNFTFLLLPVEQAAILPAVADTVNTNLRVDVGG